MVFARLGVRRAGSVGVVAFGAAGGPRVRILPPRGSKPGMVAVRKLLEQGVAPDGRRMRTRWRPRWRGRSSSRGCLAWSS